MSELPPQFPPASNAFSQGLVQTHAALDLLCTLGGCLEAAVVVVDNQGRLVFANASARERFGLDSTHFGQALQHLSGCLGGPTLQALIEACRLDAAPKSGFLDADGALYRIGAAMSSRQAHASGGPWVVLTLQDVTPIQQLQERLALQGEALDLAAQGVVLVDAMLPDHPMVHVSDGFLRLTGYERDEVLGRNCRFLQGRDTDPDAVADLRRAIQGQTPARVEILNYRKGGARFWNSLRVHPLHHSQGKAQYFLGLQEDVTEARLRFLAMHRRAHHDALTGLPNRGFLLAALSRLVEASSATPFCLLFLDLDGFKSVNDQAGHQTGDELLIGVAERLCASVRSTDIVARLGGDEFVVLLCDAPRDALVEQIAENILRRLRAPFGLSQGRFEVRGSIGIARWPSAGRSADAVLTAADRAMYAAKAAGRDTLRWAVSELGSTPVTGGNTPT